MNATVRVALAQIKPVTGDLEGNVEKIVNDIRRARAEHADIVLFPETVITGYCCGAMFEQEDFIAYNKVLLEEIVAREVPEDMVAVVGFVDRKGTKKDGFMDITNSVAVIQGGKIVDVYDKMLLANGNHHEDKKYFTPGTEAKVIAVEIGGKTIRLGVPICEDVWHQDHERDIVQEMVDAGAELILSANVSYFYYGKQEVRRALFGGHAREKNVPVCAVNTVGVGDIVKNILIYDGGSLAFDGEGNLINELARFNEDFQVVDVPLSGKSNVTKQARIQGKYEELFDALVFEQKELFDVISIPHAQVHVSGGLDSAIVAALVVEAMGKERTVLISNPTEDNSNLTKGLAQQVADTLGVRLYWNPTQEPYQSVVAAHERSFGVPPSLTGKACIQAVLRTVQGIGAYHHFKSGIVATGNHTEIVEGWASFHDIGSIGVHAPIGDLTKVELFQFAQYINGRLGKEVVPHVLFDGSVKPAAELADAKDDPLDYWVRAGIDAELVRHRKSVNDLVFAYRSRTLTSEFFPNTPDGKSVYDRYDEPGFTKQVLEAFANSKRSVFKCAQGAPIVIVSPRSRGFSNRETIINQYQGWYDVRALKEKFAREADV